MRSPPRIELSLEPDLEKPRRKSAEPAGGGAALTPGVLVSPPPARLLATDGALLPFAINGNYYKDFIYMYKVIFIFRLIHFY